jgi:hypothetical protein
MSVTSVTLPSAFAVGTYSPAFNPAQAIPANNVSGEQQVVAPNAGSDVLFVVPSYAPFFANTVVLTYTPSGGSAQPLTPGVDYFFALPFISASRALSAAVFGAIVMANNQLAGTIGMAYTTLGGVWVTTVAANQALESRIGTDVYVTAFEQVANYSSVFPQVMGPWDKPDPTGMPDVIKSLTALINQMANSVLTEQSASAQGILHLFDEANPHRDNAASVGLGNVVNYPPATDLQATDSSNNITYISPAQLKLAFAAGLPHANDGQLGVFLLNLGLPGADAVSPTLVLTAASFASLIQTPGSGIYAGFNRSQQEATFSPYPFTFPATWQGSSYANMTQLLRAVATAAGVSTVEFNATTGKVWFPMGTTLPALAIPS